MGLKDLEEKVDKRLTDTKAKPAPTDPEVLKKLQEIRERIKPTVSPFTPGENAPREGE